MNRISVVFFKLFHFRLGRSNSQKNWQPFTWDLASISPWGEGQTFYPLAYWNTDWQAYTREVLVLCVQDRRNPTCAERQIIGIQKDSSYSCCLLYKSFTNSMQSIYLSTESNTESTTYSEARSKNSKSEPESYSFSPKRRSNLVKRLSVSHN